VQFVNCSFHASDDLQTNAAAVVDMVGPKTGAEGGAQSRPYRLTYIILWTWTVAHAVTDTVCEEATALAIIHNSPATLIEVHSDIRLAHAGFTVHTGLQTRLAVRN